MKNLSAGFGAKTWPVITFRVQNKDMHTSGKNTLLLLLKMSTYLQYVKDNVHNPFHFGLLGCS